MEPNEGQGTAPEENAQGQGEVDSSSEGTGINPAWNDFLEVIPSQLHSQVTPHLQKWDQNYQNGIQKVHSQYEPYKFLVENEVPADNVQYGINLVNAIENNPQEVLKALQEWIGEESEGEEAPVAEQTSEQGQETPEWLQHPEFKQMKDTVTNLATTLQQERDQQEQAKINQQIEKELTDLKTEFGDYDEEWVLIKASNDPNGDLKAAVQAYKNFEKAAIERAQQANTNAPPVLPSGSAPVTQQLNPSTLDDKGRRNLVTQLLQQAKSQTT